MSRFAHRSSAKELIDQDGISFRDWELCLKELNAVNTLLGGHSITIDGVRQIALEDSGSLTIAEIGCGGGDNLKAIWQKYRSRNINYIGIDINKACVSFAEENCKEIPGAKFIFSDYRNVNFGSTKPDIIFNSLFCHHFSNEELVQMILWMKSNSRSGFFINDLQRHPVAYHSISMLTKLFSKSYLVKHDAPISVSRGFRKADWSRIMKQAGVTKYSISWRWAFRYLVLFKHE